MNGLGQHLKDQQHLSKKWSLQRRLKGPREEGGMLVAHIIVKERECNTKDRMVNCAMVLRNKAT